MAKTAVVNPKRKRRRRRRSNPSSANRRRRRRNYGAAAVVNPRRRRRRRRTYGAARRGRRRRNPISPYSSTAYYRRPNPPGLERMAMDLAMTIPAATAGVFAARFALKQAGSFEPASDGVLEPGLKHAVAVLIAAEVGGRLLGEVAGNAAGDAARIAALGFGGDLFMRARFLRNNDFVRNNISLQGMGSEETLYVDSQGQVYQLSGASGAALAGFQNASALGDSYVDSDGNVFISDEAGNWSLAGALGQQFVRTEDGQLYQLNGSDGAVLAGFQNESSLGMAPAVASSGSSFGYSPLR